MWSYGIVLALPLYTKHLSEELVKSAMETVHWDAVIVAEETFKGIEEPAGAHNETFVLSLIGRVTYSCLGNSRDKQDFSS